MVQQPPGPPPGGMQPPPPPPGPPGMPPQAPMERPRPQFDTSNLPLADIVVVFCALILIIMSGIGWYKSDIKGEKDISYEQAFQLYEEGNEISPYDFYEFGLGGGAMSILAMVFGILLLVFALVMMANKYLNFIPMELPTGLIYLGFTAFILLFLVLGIFVKPGFSIAGISIPISEMEGFKPDLSWAMWIVSLIFALGIGAGGVMKLAESK